jgi:membrane protein
MNDWIKRLGAAYRRLVWETAPGSASQSRRVVITMLRLLHNLVMTVMEGPLTLRAMSLVYTTLLSLVPLLAVSFSVLKALGVHNQMQPMLDQLLEPLGQQGRELTRYIIGFVNNMKVGVLGSVGLAVLIYTVVSLVQKVEEAFNYIWGVRQSRPLIRRFSDYMSVILVGPVLVFSALGITAAVMSSDIVQSLSAVQPFAAFIDAIGRLLPYVLIVIAFTFVYMFIPNTKVHFGAALAGGLLGGILWESAGWAFAAFVASSSRYQLIYSSFAIVIMFMIWLYVSWLILLLGAQVAYYHQYPVMLNTRRGLWQLGNREQEQIAVSAMTLIAYNYFHQQPWWQAEGLAARLNVPPLALLPILDRLESRNLLSASSDHPPQYFPARDIATIPVLSILEAIRLGETPAGVTVIGLDQTEEIMKRVDEALYSSLARQTVKDLVLACSPPKAQPV